MPSFFHLFLGYYQNLGKLLFYRSRKLPLHLIKLKMQQSLYLLLFNEPSTQTASFFSFLLPYIPERIVSGKMLYSEFRRFTCNNFTLSAPAQNTRLQGFASQSQSNSSQEYSISKSWRIRIGNSQRKALFATFICFSFLNLKYCFLDVLF